MMEKKENQLDTLDAMDEIRLQYECEQAFVRHRFPKPPVDAEWERFKSQMDGKEEAQAKSLPRTLALKWIGVAMAAAVFIGAVFIFASDNQVEVESKPLVVLLERRNGSSSPLESQIIPVGTTEETVAVVPDRGEE